MKYLKSILLSSAALVLAACSAPAARPQEIILEATDIAYGTTTIEVTAGQPVRLTLKSTGALEHDFSILEIPVVIKSEAAPVAGHDMGTTGDEHSEPELHVAAAPGQSNTVEFTPTKAGTYQFYCTVAGHKDAGMVGTLIVNEP